MATELPIPITFEIPNGWQAADPDRIGAPEAAFVAVHPESQQPHSLASITIDGHVQSEAETLAGTADESVQNVEQLARTVTVTHRSELGTPASPGLGQVLRMSVEINGVERELFQCQIYLALVDVSGPERRAILRLVLTANQQQYTELMDDFQQFVASVAPDESIEAKHGE
ncbi:hypothetical protein FHR84_001744 [Actinopolyspora biskrensis]|uniref:DUF1795 domain-containing protein n=1 Tax=Actinopolyspora biskrensis TaxID=1470178 RepID=A0A852YY02_9ACTN|nr:hypothetical protein [Actinopolyspora biskrensis]NYH78419.1 hypothetical protein [Actinopolyspora biskrensis]